MLGCYFAARKVCTDLALRQTINRTVGEWTQLYIELELLMTLFVLWGYETSLKEPGVELPEFTHELYTAGVRLLTAPQWALSPLPFSGRHSTAHQPDRHSHCSQGSTADLCLARRAAAAALL